MRMVKCEIENRLDKLLDSCYDRDHIKGGSLRRVFFLVRITMIGIKHKCHENYHSMEWLTSEHLYKLARIWSDLQRMNPNFSHYSASEDNEKVHDIHKYIRKLDSIPNKGYWNAFRRWFAKMDVKDSIGRFYLFERGRQDFTQLMYYERDLESHLGELIVELGLE